MQYIAKFLTYVVAVGLSKYMPKKMTSNVTGLWVLGTISFLLVVSGMGVANTSKPHLRLAHRPQK
jgi:hypothetical protein